MWIQIDRHLWKIAYRGLIKANPSLELINWEAVRLSIKSLPDPKKSLIVLRPLTNQIYHHGTKFDGLKTFVGTILPKDFVVNDWVQQREIGGVINDLARAFDGTYNARTNRFVVEFNSDELEIASEMKTTIGIELRERDQNGRYNRVPKDRWVNVFVNKENLSRYFLHVYAGDNHPMLYGDAYTPLK